MEAARKSIADIIGDFRMNARPYPPEPSKPPKDGIICTRCDGSGWVPIERENGTIAMAHCPECYERRQVARRLKQSGISPKDYERYTLNSFDGNRSPVAREMKFQAVKYLNEHQPGGIGFGLFGKSGMGKTHICIAVCQELTKHFHEPHYYFSYRAEIPKLVKASRSYSTDYDAAMHKWKTCQNLYIDDLFKLSGKVVEGRLVDIDREELKVVFDLINARYLNHLTTLFSSEYLVKDITDIDEALGSRIYEMVFPYALKVEGENQRLEGLGHD